MKKLVVLISGRGSNMVAIARAMQAEGWQASIAAVISNRPHAPGLHAARELGLDAWALDHTAFASRVEFEGHLAERIDALAPDYLVLAGFMLILGPAFVERFAGRIVNIHPSLLPSFTGLHTHRRALAAGVRAHGATVHFVTAELDAGPIIAQAVVPVRAGDDEARLQARVQRAEHELYPSALRWLVEGRVRSRDLTTEVAGVSPLLIVECDE